LDSALARDCGEDKVLAGAQGLLKHLHYNKYKELHERTAHQLTYIQTINNQRTVAVIREGDINAEDEASNEDGPNEEKDSSSEEDNDSSEDFDSFDELDNDNLSSSDE
jgi:hypothetical protein